MLSQVLWSERCTQMQCSGSGLGAGPSGIASTYSDGSSVNYRPCRVAAVSHRHAVALALMQTDRVSPARTPTAAEPTRCSIAAAVSTDIDGNGLCVHRACAAAEWSTHGHTQHTPVGPATEAAAPCVCVCVMRVMRQLLESKRCSQMRCSGSGSDAGRSGL